jgi:pimeloyl-ACP methyl ester carboxylesterase
LTTDPTTLRTTYCQFECLAPPARRSPVVFLHGFPDSPLMFADYYSDAERAKPWLAGRGIYTVAMPNRFTNPHYPPLAALVRDVVRHEIHAYLRERIAASPTGKIVLIAHDWGATYSWAFCRAGGAGGIEKMVALSVGSSFRYDVWEHGLRALAWAYSLMFGSPWAVPIPAYRRLVARIIMQTGGYRGAELERFHQDCYHYWYGLVRLLALPTDLLGLRYQPPYVDFPFPVLYMRSPQDRIATTRGFEEAVQCRPDCRYHVIEGANHWFPEQQSERVLHEVRPFLEG